MFANDNDKDKISQKLIIINDLAKNKIVEEIIKKITGAPYTIEKRDLAQDIYLALLEKDPDLIIKMHKKNEMKYYIVAMVRNNYFSSTSVFFNKYRKYMLKSLPLIYYNGEEKFTREEN